MVSGTFAESARLASMAEGELRLVTFDVGGDLFALDIMGIIQIIKYEGSTDVPKAPDFIEGIILLRDEVIPIVDLQQRLFPEQSSEDGDKRVLIIRFQDTILGLKTDHVRKIVSVRTDAILPAPPIIQGLDARFVDGVVKIDDQVVLVVNLAQILTVSEVEQLAAVQATAAR